MGAAHCDFYVYFYFEFNVSLNFTVLSFRASALAWAFAWWCRCWAPLSLGRRAEIHDQFVMWFQY